MRLTELTKYIEVYHVTLEDNVPSIKQHGLIPKIGKNSELIGEKEKGIHVFKTHDALEDALMNWDTMNWLDEDVELSLITLRVPEDIVEPRNSWYAIR